MKWLAQKINSDKDFKKNTFEYIKNQLDEEISKPIGKRDFGRIESLTADLRELLDDESQDNITERGINKLNSRIVEYAAERKKPSFKFSKKFMPVLCAAAVMLAANCVSVMAWNMNIFSAVIEFTKGGFSVDFGSKQHEAIELPTSDNDPFGIIAECAKYDVFPTEAPTYIPDGFVMTDTEHNVNENYANIVCFEFRKGNQFLTFDYTRYWSDKGSEVIPSDHYNISEITVNGTPAIVSKEDNQYIMVYEKGDTEFYMYADGVNYSECEKIVDSIK